MEATDKPTTGAVVIDFKQAMKAVSRRDAAGAFRGRLLKGWAQRISADDLSQIRDAVRMGVIEGLTTSQIVRNVVRDQVRAKARAAL